MDGQLTRYVSPRLVRVGGFAELTQGSNIGTYVDNPWGGWFL